MDEIDEELAELLMYLREIRFEDPELYAALLLLAKRLRERG